jgi:hypothetical protein
MEIKDAVLNAMDFARSSLGPERTVGIRLEEIESSYLDERAVWIITLSSLSRPKIEQQLWPTAVGPDADREYKTFTVAKDTGEVLAMKIRLLALPTV